eukprot:3560781-Amphidinium_carterae.1
MTTQGRSLKKTDKDKQPIPLRPFDLKSPALPYTIQRNTTIPDWNFKPPDQPVYDAPPRAQKFPTFTKKQQMTVQPPLGLQQPKRQQRQHQLLKSNQLHNNSNQSDAGIGKITTKITLAKNDLLATIDTGVLHLSTNEDAEEKKLSLDNMHLQEWYDDDDKDYDANELKTAIKEEHDSVQKTNVFTRVKATDYNHTQTKTQSTIRSERIHTECQHRRNLHGYTRRYHTTNLTHHSTTQQPQHIH